MEEQDNKLDEARKEYRHMRMWNNPLHLIVTVSLLVGILSLLGDGVLWLVQFVSGKTIDTNEGIEILKVYYFEFVMLLGFPLIMIYLWWNRKGFVRPLVKTLYYLRQALFHGGWLFFTIIIVLLLAVVGGVKWGFLPDDLMDMPIVATFFKVIVGILIGGVVLLVLSNMTLWLIHKLTGVGSEVVAHKFLYQDNDGLYKPMEYIEDKTLLKFYQRFPKANHYYWDDITLEMEAKEDFEGWTKENIIVRFFAAQQRKQYVDHVYKAVSMQVDKEQGQ